LQRRLTTFCIAVRLLGMSHSSWLLVSFRVHRGPPVFERALAAYQLTACLSALEWPASRAVTETGLLPVALAACDDPSPSVQQAGLVMLRTLAAEVRCHYDPPLPRSFPGVLLHSN
jgi:hypothetical protein